MAAELQPTEYSEEMFPPLEVISSEMKPQKHKRLSGRRKVAVAVGIVIGYAATVFGGVAGSVNESNDDMRNAQVTSTEFVTRNEQMLRNKTIGMSVDPNTSLEALDYFHRELGVTYDRVQPGNMHDNARVVNGEVQYDFSESKPVIDKLMNYKDEHITFDLGVKEYGYPEQRVAEQHKQDLINASKGNGTIEPGSVLGKEAIKYENAFVDFLLANYTSKQLDNIYAFQFQNEKDFKYGENAVGISDSQEELEIVNNMKTFPKKVRYLVNSAGFLNIDSLTIFIKGLNVKYPELRGRLILGIDYYRHVGSIDTPIGKIDPLDWPIAGRVDPLVVDKTISNLTLNFFGNKLTNLAQTADENDFTTEATEVGFPPWDGYANGKSQFPADLANVQYSIERVSKFADPNKQFTIGAWKLYDLYQNRKDPEFAYNIKEIFTLIKKINTKDKSATADLNLKQVSHPTGELVTLVDFTPLGRAA